MAALLMWLAARWIPELTVALPYRGWIAICIALVGALIAVAGVVSFSRARTTVDPTRPTKASALVVSGIYQHTLNPIYLGFTTILLALAVSFANLLSFAVLPFFVVYLTRFQIQPEEGALASLFPDEFGAYTARVRRWM